MTHARVFSTLLFLIVAAVGACDVPPPALDERPAGLPAGLLSDEPVVTRQPAPEPLTETSDRNRPTPEPTFELDPRFSVKRIFFRDYKDRYIAGVTDGSTWNLPSINSTVRVYVYFQRGAGAP